MGESCSSCEKCCNTKEQSGSSCGGEKGEKFAEGLLEIADAAWMEVLKEKIKEHIVATQGDRMTELAKILSEGNSQRWRQKMEKKHSCMDFKEKLQRFFSQSKK